MWFNIKSNWYLQKKNDFSAKEKEKETPTGEGFQQEEIINNFCNLKNDLIQEQAGNEQRQKDFRINFNKRNYNSFTYPDWLQNSLKIILINIEDSFKQYEKTLSYYNEQIKESIKKILNEKINFYEASSEYNDLKMNIQQTISDQKKRESDSLNKKNNDITSAFMGYMRDKISSSMGDLKRLVKEITEIKKNNETFLQECQKKVNYIIKKENEIKNNNYFMANEIKKKEENLDILKRNRVILVTHITFLNSNKDKLSKMIEDFNMIEKSNLNNTYQNEEIWEKILKNITKLNDEIGIEINNKKNNPQESIDFAFIESEIKNISNAPAFILKDSFYNKEDKDKAYNNLKEKEKLIVPKIYYDNR